MGVARDTKERQSEKRGRRTPTDRNENKPEKRGSACEENSAIDSALTVSDVS